MQLYMDPGFNVAFRQIQHIMFAFIKVILWAS